MGASFGRWWEDWSLKLEKDVGRGEGKSMQGGEQSVQDPWVTGGLGILKDQDAVVWEGQQGGGGGGARSSSAQRWQKGAYSLPKE